MKSTAKLRKAILLFTCSVFSIFELKAQYARITYPIDRAIFQQNFDGNTDVSLSFQIDMLRFTQDNGLSSGVPIYKVEKVESQVGETVIGTPRNWSLLSPFSNWTLSPIDFKGYLVNDLSLEVGWYRVTIGVYFSDPNANFIAPLSSVKFGIGDVYIVAGQSNASGYDETEDDVINYTNTFPTIEQYDCVSSIFPPLNIEGKPDSYEEDRKSVV